MADAIIGPVSDLPAGAELVLRAEHVVRFKGTIFVGRIECAELRPGDHVVAVTDKPVCRGVVVGIERFRELTEVARRGDEVGVLVRGWGAFPVGVGARLFLVARANRVPSSEAIQKALRSS
jgi:translation elongation factor EF-Tu-like GTPase